MSSMLPLQAKRSTRLGSPRLLSPVRLPVQLSRPFLVWQAFGSSGAGATPDPKSLRVGGNQTSRLARWRQTRRAKQGGPFRVALSLSLGLSGHVRSVASPDKRCPGLAGPSFRHSLGRPFCIRPTARAIMREVLRAPPDRQRPMGTAEAATAGGSEGDTP